MSTARAEPMEPATRHNGSVPKIIQVLLKIRGATAADLAQAMDLSPSQLSERLSGKTRMSVDELRDAAAFLRVDPGVLYLTLEVLMSRLSASEKFATPADLDDLTDLGVAPRLELAASH